MKCKRIGSADFLIEEHGKPRTKGIAFASLRMDLEDG